MIPDSYLHVKPDNLDDHENDRDSSTGDVSRRILQYIVYGCNNTDSVKTG